MIEIFRPDRTAGMSGISSDDWTEEAAEAIIKMLISFMYEVVETMNT